MLLPEEQKVTAAAARSPRPLSASWLLPPTGDPNLPLLYGPGVAHPGAACALGLAYIFIFTLVGGWGFGVDGCPAMGNSDGWNRGGERWGACISFVFTLVGGGAGAEGQCGETLFYGFGAGAGSQGGMPSLSGRRTAGHLLSPADAPACRRQPAVQPTVDGAGDDDAAGWPGDKHTAEGAPGHVCQMHTVASMPGQITDLACLHLRSRLAGVADRCIADRAK